MCDRWEKVNCEYVYPVLIGAARRKRERGEKVVMGKLEEK